MTKLRGDISGNALRLARAVDRSCRSPGSYQVLINVPVSRSRDWHIAIAKIDRISELRSAEPGRRSSSGS